VIEKDDRKYCNCLNQNLQPKWLRQDIRGLQTYVRDIPDFPGSGWWFVYLFLSFFLAIKKVAAIQISKNSNKLDRNKVGRRV
jgi:hypothetical protein